MDEQRFQRAISLRDSGRLEEAASELRSLVEDSSNAPDIERGLILLNEAICLSHMDGTFEKARRLLEEASPLLGRNRSMRALVDSTDASFYMGRDPKKALQKFDSVSRKYADVLGLPEEIGLYGENQLRRGLLLVELKRYREARPVLEEVLTLDVEKDSAFYFNLGICYLELRESELARQRLLQALGMGLPEDRIVKTHFYLGVVYFRTRAYGKALQEFEFCEANINKSTLPLRGLYKWLALTCRNVGREESARKYSQLAANT
jgi:tetratricopeptide (TPR) repeat protein